MRHHGVTCLGRTLESLVPHHLQLGGDTIERGLKVKIIKKKKRETKNCICTGQELLRTAQDLCIQLFHILSISRWLL